MHVGLMQTASRGRIELRSKDPSAPPRILVNYLSDEKDRDVMRKGIRLVRELLEQPAEEGSDRRLGNLDGRLPRCPRHGRRWNHDQSSGLVPEHPKRSCSDGRAGVGVAHVS